MKLRSVNTGNHHVCLTSASGHSTNTAELVHSFIALYGFSWKKICESLIEIQ